LNKTRLNINEAFKLATNFHIKNQINNAKNLYIQILKIKPDYIDAMNNLGELYRHQGQFDKAIDLFKKVLNINSNNAIAYNNLGLVYKEQNKLLDARSCFEKAYKINSDYILPLYNMGIVLKLIGDYKKSKECYLSVIKKNPNHLASINNLAILLDELGEFSLAKNYYEKGLKIDPNNLSILWNLHILAEDFDEALSLIKKIHKIDKNHNKAKIMISALESFNGSFDKFNNIANSKLADHPYFRSIKWIMSLQKKPKIFFNRLDFFDGVIKLADKSRPFYEFGVWNGASFKYLINSFKKGYGFDTFTGLPETWHNEPKGNYSNFGAVPKIDGGEFIVGKFEDTLPKFFSKNRPLASLINFDADLYSSTICAISNSKNIIDQNTILIFDEFIMNDNWEQDEFKALNEFCQNENYNYEVLAFCLASKQVAVKLSKN